MAPRTELPHAEMESLLDQPETYRALLGEYDGPVSLGITVDELTGETCFLLRIADVAAVQRRELEVDGQMVRVLVRSGYRTPTPG
jgi:hypothetical protein